MDAVADPPRTRRYPSQEKRFTPKLQAYAEALASGLSQADAAKRAGYKSKQGANEATRHPMVQQYVQSVRNRVCAKIAHTVVIAMQEAADTMQFAREKGNPMAYCKAVELRAKLSGLLIDRVEVFSMDMRGAMAEAQRRVVSVNPALAALPQLTEAEAQAEPDPSA